VTFGYVNLAASQTALQGYMVIPGASFVGVQDDEQMIYAGSVLAIAFRATTQKSTGSASFGIAVGGSVEESLAWSSGQRRGSTTYGPGEVEFAAGDDVGVRATTDSAFAPTTVDVVVRLYCSFAPS
jgi:hypothetical protein